MLTQIGRREVPEDLVGLLLECHERIRRFVHIAEQAARRTDVPESEIVEACEGCERYFNLALPLHVQDEEQSVYPRLHGKSAEVDAALSTMREQHAAHEATLTELLAALAAVRGQPGNREARGRLERAAVALEAELEEHLGLEERVILPAVKERLSHDEQRAIIGELRARRRVE